MQNPKTVSGVKNNLYETGYTVYFPKNTYISTLICNTFEWYTCTEEDPMYFLSLHMSL